MKLWKIAALILAALSLFATSCGAAEEAADTAKDAVEETADKAKEATEETADKAKEAVEETADKAKEAVEETADKAKEAVKDSDEKKEEAKEEEKKEEEKEEEKKEEAPAEAVDANPAPSATCTPYEPTGDKEEGMGFTAGEGGELLILQWQAPSQANAYLSSGTKDRLVSSMVLEPMAVFNPEAKLEPALAEYIPTIDNCGVSEDMTHITWTLKEGLVFSDGSPVTAEDAVFSWEYCQDPQTACSTEAFEPVVAVEALDERTIQIQFDSPQPFPYNAFVGAASPIIQKAQFKDCVGAAAVGCSDQNFAPIGTGPFRVTDLKPEDTTTLEFNPEYRGNEIGQPFFTTVTIKGGGDAEAAARSVLEIGEADYAWNLQVAPEIIGPMEAAGNGRLQSGFANQVEHIQLNQTNNRNADNPSAYMDGNNPHPIFFENPELQHAMSIAIDRDELVAVGYGAAGIPTCNMWNVGEEASPNNDECLIQDIDEANRILDEDLGYLDNDGDGVREFPDGTPLEFDYVTSTNNVRQSNQELIKDYWAQIGIKANLRNESASLFFDGTSASDVSIWKFFADIQMYAYSARGPDAMGYLRAWYSSSIPQPETSWGGSNMPRMVNPEYDATLDKIQTLRMDDPERIELIWRANDILASEHGAVIPLILRATPSAIANDIKGVGTINGWDSEYWNIQEWYREG